AREARVVAAMAEEQPLGAGGVAERHARRRAVVHAQRLPGDDEEAAGARLRGHSWNEAEPRGHARCLTPVRALRLAGGVWYRPRLVKRDLATVVLALVGAALRSCAALDWVGYHAFVGSLRWL